MVQQAWRGRQGRQQVELMRAMRNAERAQREKELSAARHMQRAWRGRMGRKEWRRRHDARQRFLLEWRSARVLQAGERGRKGRAIARRLREEREYRLMVAAAIKLQTAWRGAQGRFMAKVAASLAALRQRERLAAIRLQAAWRGKRGRQRAIDQKKMLIEMQRRERNALILQRVFRGHKGRERWEVHERLRELDAKVQPLKLRLKQLQEDREKVIEEHEAKKVKLDELSDDTDKLEKEVKMMLTMRNKYWDSSRISGAPQRFLTKYLQVRLAEQLEEQQASVAEMKDQYDEMLVHERELDRQIRQVRRELRPLTEGMVDFVMKARTKRLRDRVRKEAWAATKLQACYRGMRYRQAVYDPNASCWIECLDNASGEQYWFNTWSQETKWTKPLSLVVFERAPQPVSSTRPTATHWAEQIDAESGHPYYFNSSTGEYRWEKPPDFDGARDAVDGTMWMATQDGRVLTERSEPTGREIGREWEEMADPESGHTYYHNRTTGETTWSLPPRVAYQSEDPE